MAETAVMESSHHQYLADHVECSGDLTAPSSRLFQTHHALGETWCPQKPSNQTMFMEGFNDCAAEVVRYLTEVERMEDNNPMLRDLQDHLTQVKRVFCQESMVSEESLEDKSCYLNDCSSERRAQNSSFMDNMLRQVACTLSPIVSMSVNSSVSDATSIESDLLSSQSSLTCRSIISDLGSSLMNMSSHAHDISLDAIRHDDVFQQSQHSPCLGSSSVLPLKQLAMQAIQRASHSQSDTNCNHPAQHQTGQFQTIPYTSCEDALVTSESLRYVLPIGQSSPVYPSTLSHCVPNHSLFHHPLHTLNQDLRNQTLDTISPLVINTNVHSNSEPLPPVYEGNIFHPLTTNSNVHQVPELPKELAQHLSSVLEQRANFLSGIDTSIVASGDLADVLLAVETCRLHSDSRVRALADEIIHLIHDDYSEDEFEDTFEDDDEEPHRNDESGIEMMDESTDWGNPSDFLEQ